MTQSTILAASNSYFDKIPNYLASWSTKRFLLTIVIVQILLHIPIVSLPPMGQHTWRQVVWMAVARNYFEENNSFLSPSQDTRIAPDHNGIIYFEFPLLPYIAGMSYHITGFSHANMRVVMLLMGIFLIFGSYKFMRSLGANEARARWFTFFISFSPYFFYYSITACPNLPALTWFIWGIALIKPQLEDQEWDWKFWLGMIFITIACLSKIIYLIFGIPVAYLFIREFNKNRNPKFIIVTLVSFFIVIVPNLLIYLHTKSLFDQAPIEQQKAMILWPGFFPETWDRFIQTFRWALIEWFLQMFVNTAAIPFFLIGFYTALKNKKWKNKSGMFWVMWAISFLIYSACFYTQFRQHAYYLTPLLIIAAMGSTYGIETSLRSGRLRGVIYVLLICIPIVMVGRVGHRWLWAKQVPDELLYQTEEIQQSVPKNDRVMVVGDTSPIIYLYYLNRKGVSMSPAVGAAKIKEYYDYGFRYIVSKVPLTDISGLDKFPHEVISQVGKFKVVKLSNR